MPRSRLVGVLVCVALAVGITAWAGTKQVNGPEGAFTLQVPEDWKVETLGDGLQLRPADDAYAFNFFLNAWPRFRKTLQEQAKAHAESAEKWAKKQTAQGERTSWRQESLQPIRLGGVDALLLRATVESPYAVQREDNYLALTAKHQVRLQFIGLPPRLDTYRDAIQAILASVRFAGEAAPLPGPNPFPTPGPAQPTPPQPMPPGPLPAPAPAQDGIVGSWLLRTEQAEVRAEFRADGRYSRSVRTAQLAQAETGTYRAAQGILELHPDGGGQVVQLRYQMPDANRLIATDAQGIGTELVRQADAPQPGPSPDPTPVPPNPIPGPMPGAMKQVQDQNGAFAISVPGDWRVQQQAGTMMACDATGQAFAQVLAAPKQFQSLDQFAQAAVANWRQSVPQWQAVGQQAVQVAGRQALQIRATGSPNNAAMMADYFLVLGDQCQVIVTVFCPQAAFPQRMATFQQIVQTLQVR